MKKVYILGAGTWGVTLGKVLAQKGHEVTIWSAINEEIEILNKTYEHKNLPGVEIPRSIRFTTSFENLVSQDFIIIAVPSIFVRSTIRKIKDKIKNQVIVDVAKGMEEDTLMTMTEIIGDELDGYQNIVAFSGPTHAEEVAIDMPTTIVAASQLTNIAGEVAELFDGTCLRVYLNVDVKGVELCGAMKNIIALAAGISDGAGFGDNTKAALITRGIAEIRRLGVAMGCYEQTFSGLAGIGDLIVTATSRHSRNNKCGNLIGKGYKVEDAIKEVGMVVEGMNALPAAVKLADYYHVEMPIIQAVNAIVNGASPLETVKKLMQRPRKDEFC